MIFFLRLAAFSVIMAFALPAWAQDMPKAPEPYQETVIVTASKRETNASEFAGSISILENRFLENHQLSTTGEISRMVPNLYYKTATSGDAFVARGISTIDTSLFSPMGLYINDVAFPLSHMQSQSLFDVERVEVLKGPQSTLYGKNSSSGVINLVLKEPGNESYARTVVTAGNYNTWSAGLSAGGAVTPDRLFWGLTLEGLLTDGYMENRVDGRDDVGKKERFSGRASLKWAPTETFSATLFLDAMDEERGISTFRFEDGPWALDPFQVYTNEADLAEKDSLGQALRIRAALGGADLTSITSHQRFSRDHIMDFDRTPRPLGHSFIDMTQDNWSQEFRLTGGKAHGTAWLAGLYASHESLDNIWRLNHVNPRMGNERITDTRILTSALFGQATMALTQNLSATAGLRLEHIDGDGHQDYTRAGRTLTYDREISETEWLPMVSLSYAPAQGVNTYITFSTGWLAGGYDCFSASSEEAFTYDPEYTRNYEAGVKTRFWDNRIQADLSLFYTTIEDKQVREEVPGGGPGAWRYSNAAEAVTKGLELQVSAFVLDNLELFGGIGYARSRIDEWVGTVGGQPVDYSGKALPWAPELTANLGLGYYSDNGLYGSADLSWAGRRYFDAANAVADDGYFLTNVKAGYRFGDFDLSVWCRNLFDTHYANRKSKIKTGHTLIEDGDPRTFGISLNWRF